MRRFLGRLIDDRSGATAVEYALIGGIVVALLVTAVTALGQQLVMLFTNVVNAFG